jgi:hypothetical protein
VLLKGPFKACLYQQRPPTQPFPLPYPLQHTPDCNYCVTPPPAPAGLVLVLAKLCGHMETTVVPYVVEVLAASFQGGAGFSDGPPRFVGGEVARHLGSTASELKGTCIYTEWMIGVADCGPWLDDTALYTRNDSSALCPGCFAGQAHSVCMH